MFSSNKKPLLETPDNFGEAFIHTMKDDLSPSLKNIPSPANGSFEAPFSQKPIEKITDKNPSPFFNNNSSVTETPVKAPVVSKTEEKKPVSSIPVKKESPSSKNPLLEKKSSSNKTTLLLITILILLVLSGGGYYIWVTTKSSSQETIKTPENIKSNIPAEDISEETVKITPLSEKYFTDKPNIITVDIETATADSMKKLLSETATEVGALQLKDPFEFIIKDTKNNSIAFPIFATASEIALSQELLSSLEENFSFYAYNDQGKTRTGLSIKIKNEKNVLSEMLKEEPTIVKTLSFLFFYESFLEKTDPFSKNTYNGVSSRFLNLDDENSISIDYGVYDGRLVIGTSKNTFRSIIDKLVSEKMSDDAEPELNTRDSSENTESNNTVLEINAEDANVKTSPSL